MTFPPHCAPRQGWGPWSQQVPDCLLQGPPSQDGIQSVLEFLSKRQHLLQGLCPTSSRLRRIPSSLQPCRPQTELGGFWSLPSPTLPSTLLLSDNHGTVASGLPLQGGLLMGVKLVRLVLSRARCHRSQELGSRQVPSGSELPASFSRSSNVSGPYIKQGQELGISAVLVPPCSPSGCLGPTRCSSTTSVCQGMPISGPNSPCGLHFPFL